MRDLPGDLGLIVIDDLPEMIGWVKKQKEVKQFTSFETFGKTPKTG